MSAELLCYDCGRARWQHPDKRNCGEPRDEKPQPRTEEQARDRAVRRDERNGRHTP